MCGILNIYCNCAEGDIPSNTTESKNYVRGYRTAWDSVIWIDVTDFPIHSLYIGEVSMQRFQWETVFCFTDISCNTN